MKDFILAALPFVIIGICLAIICAKFKENKKTYCTEGMSIGMCLGVALSSAININIGLGISLGMLIGETIGIFIEKKNK